MYIRVKSSLMPVCEETYEIVNIDNKDLKMSITFVWSWYAIPQRRMDKCNWWIRYKNIYLLMKIEISLSLPLPIRTHKHSLYPKLSSLGTYSLHGACFRHQKMILQNHKNLQIIASPFLSPLYRLLLHHFFNELSICRP